MLDFQPVADLLKAARDLQAKVPPAVRGTREFAALEAALAGIKQAQHETAESRDAIATARRIYGSEDIQIDPAPAVSITDEGAWISAWLWVEEPQ